MTTSRTFLACALYTALVPASAMAGSLALNDFSSRSAGRGTAAVAATDDPAAIYFNPANIALLEGFQFDLGAGGAMPRFSYEPVGGGPKTTSNVSLVTPPWMSLTYNLGNVAGIGDIAAGLGVYVPLGSAFSWPKNWAGQQEVRKINLQVFEVSPVVAWRLGEKIAVGAGFRYLPCSVYMSQAVSFGSERPAGSVELAGKGHGLGFNAGIGVYATDTITLGLSYRSGATLKLKGDADFDFPEPFDTQAVDAKVETNIATAAFWRAGIAVDAIPNRLMLAFDVERATWSNFKELAVTFKNPDGTTKTVVSPRDSRDSWTLHFGADYQITDEVAVRAGYIHDQHTAPESTVNPAPPDSDQRVVALGASYFFGEIGGIKDFGLHVHFENVFFAKRTSTTAPFPGTWKGGYPFGTSAYLFGLSLTGSFEVGGKSRWETPPPVTAMTATGDNNSYSLARK